MTTSSATSLPRQRGPKPRWLQESNLVHLPRRPTNRPMVTTSLRVSIRRVMLKRIRPDLRSETARTRSKSIYILRPRLKVVKEIGRPSKSLGLPLSKQTRQLIFRSEETTMLTEPQIYRNRTRKWTSTSTLVASSIGTSASSFNRKV